jgi:preprotein translocase subunit SecY
MLLVKVIPAWKAMQEEGGSGRRKLNQYTRYLTVAICLFQSAVACIYLANMQMWIMSKVGFVFLGVMTITTGTIVLMWIGEQISEFGIGNGISLIIMINIISRIPLGLKNAVKNFSFNPESGSQFGVGVAITLFLLFLGILFGVVYIYLGKRKIPVQYGRQIRGRRQMGGQKQAIWLRVNQAGVIPVIFASALLTFPMMIANRFDLGIFGMSSFEYNAAYIFLIVFFSYFYTSMMFNPEEIADQLKEHGSFIPGYRAGKKTSDYLTDTMIHLTFVGAVFLAVVAILPKILGDFIKIEFLAYSGLFGGVGLLIVIGVSLDLMQKIQEHFLMRDYGGFLKKKLKGRRR